MISKLVSVSLNDDITNIVTEDGTLFQAGYQDYFTSFCQSVVSTVTCERLMYILSDCGVVYSLCLDNLCVRKIVYSSKDYAVQIKGGKNHLLILTKNKRVFGAGDNTTYQIKPHGLCFYDKAIEIIIQKYLTYECHCLFAGEVNEFCRKCVCPPPCPLKEQCTPMTYPQGTFSVEQNITISPVIINGVSPSSVTLPATISGTTNITCCSLNGILFGSVTFTINSVLVTAGTYGTTTIIPDLQLVDSIPTNQLTQTVILDNLLCNSNPEIIFTLYSDIPIMDQLGGRGIIVGSSAITSSLGPLQNATGVSIQPIIVMISLMSYIPCCHSPCQNVIAPQCCCGVEQPTWDKIFAGFNTSVILDDCGKMWTFGSIYQINPHDSDCDFLTILNDCHIGSITIVNEKSMKNCRKRVINTNGRDIIIDVCENYTINGKPFCLDDVIVLKFNDLCVNVNVFVDICEKKIIKIIYNNDQCTIFKNNVVFNPLKSNIINFGRVRKLGTKINTYVQNGDTVKISCDDEQMVTADLPTVLMINELCETEKIMEVSIGCNNLSVLTCEGNIFALGNNNFGQLGLGNNHNVICFQKVDRCVFKNNIVRIFSGSTVTFYVSCDGRIYASGSYGCLFDESQCPVKLHGIRKSWNVKKICVSKNNIVLLGGNGKAYGYGSNEYGQLGYDQNYSVDTFSKLIY